MDVVYFFLTETVIEYIAIRHNKINGNFLHFSEIPFNIIHIINSCITIVKYNNSESMSDKATGFGT